jgi:hypothetical protein
VVYYLPLRKILVSWEDTIPNIWKNKIHHDSLRETPINGFHTYGCIPICNLMW